MKETKSLQRYNLSDYFSNLLKNEVQELIGKRNRPYFYFIIPYRWVEYSDISSDMFKSNLRERIIYHNVIIKMVGGYESSCEEIDKIYSYDLFFFEYDGELYISGRDREAMMKFRVYFGKKLRKEFKEKSKSIK